MARKWSANHKKMFEFIQQHPILYELYENRYQYAKSTQHIWKDMAKTLQFTSSYCKRLWTDVKVHHSMLMWMIHLGKVSEEKVRTNPLTCKYFEECLDFLKPYALDIPYGQLPTRVDMFFKSAFKSEAEFMNEISWPDTEGEPESILPNDDDDESSVDIDKDGDIIMGDPMSQSIKQEQSTEAHIAHPILKNALTHNLSHKTKVVKIEVEDTDTDYDENENDTSEMKIEPHFISEDDMTNVTYNTANINNDPIKMFLIKYIDSEERTDMNEYLKDLTDVLCSRLAQNKRKRFLSQIDVLVSQLLEGS